MSKLAAFLLRAAQHKGISLADSELAGNDKENLGAAQSSSLYGSADYWQARYAEGCVGVSPSTGTLSNEWYVEYRALRDILQSSTSRTARTLVLGTGLSLLAEEMALDGYSHLLAVDYSPVCIERMQSRDEVLRRKQAATYAGISYQVMDVTSLSLQDASRAAALDKGTLDSLLNTREPTATAAAMLSEACRVLQPGGVFVCVSHSGPEDRLALLTAPGLSWQLEQHEEVRKQKAVFHVYLLRKQATG